MENQAKFQPGLTGVGKKICRSFWWKKNTLHLNVELRQQNFHVLISTQVWDLLPHYSVNSEFRNFACISYKTPDEQNVRELTSVVQVQMKVAWRMKMQSLGQYCDWRWSISCSSCSRLSVERRLLHESASFVVDLFMDVTSNTPSLRTGKESSKMISKKDTRWTMLVTPHFWITLARNGENQRAPLFSFSETMLTWSPLARLCISATI